MADDKAVPTPPTGDPLNSDPVSPVTGTPPSSDGEAVIVVNMLNKPGYSGAAESIINDHGIINLSSYVLSDYERLLLQKGLSFCPSPGECNLSKARDAVDKLHRSLRLAHFFEENYAFASSEDEGFDHQNFRPPSNWVPTEHPPASLASFMTANTAALNDLPILRSKFKNLAFEERQALHDLSNNRNIVIKPADKGSGVVIMNTQDYTFEAFRQLSDTSFYQSLDSDITLAISYDISKTLLNMRANKEIGKKCLSYLLPKNPRPERFYLLPKIHKNILPPPGRPIISAIGSPTEKISEFLDFFLQPLLTSIPSYVKDTGHFLHLLQNIGPLPHGTLLVTYDVTSLYTNIPLPEAERAVARMLIHSRPHATTPSNPSLLKLLRHVFQGNIFTFSDGKKIHYYLQTNGVSMGSKCAPSVACTFMGDFERTHIDTLPDNQPKPLIWLRFIDDIFAIWTHGSAKLLDFNTWLNSRHNSLNFTCSHSETSVVFLDTTVKLNCGLLETELYIKPTSSLSYLHRTSSHPTHVFKSLPYGEFLRVRRNCTHLDSFDHFAEILLQAFVDRGYDRASLIRARDQARSKNRSTLLASYANPQVQNTSNANTSNSPR